MAELGSGRDVLSPEDKEGIHELPQEAPVGEDPDKDILKMDDEIIDFELTANKIGRLIKCTWYGTELKLQQYIIKK